MTDTPILVTPTKAYAASYAEALRGGMEAHHVTEEEIRRVEEDFDGWWHDENDLSIPVMLADGRAAPRVPHSEFWLVDGMRFLGRISIRHELTEFLRTLGGHIGYAVRKDARSKGYGHLMMELVRPHARALGITRALITCKDDNAGSIRIIEKAGGVLQDKIRRPQGDILQRRYFLDV